MTPHRLEGSFASLDQMQTGHLHRQDVLCPAVGLSRSEKCRVHRCVIYEDKGRLQIRRQKRDWSCLSLEFASVAEVSESGIADAAVPVLFTIATVALTVVTIGVIYLNVSSWLESRSASNKKKEKKQEYDKDMKEFMTTAKGDKSKEKKPIKKATEKGFGPS